MNSRNLDFVRPYNKREAKRIADNKLLTKRILRKNGIGVPKLLGKIKSLEELEAFAWEKLPNSFVLKPNKGLGGEGIMVVYGKKKNGNWVKATREEVSIQDLKNHIITILEGNYSLAGVKDVAFFEERIKILKLLKPYSFRGIPDIRVIVFNNVPVMAMLRLPTEQSGGRANLHLGGISTGIDLASGITTSSITKNLTTQREYLIDSLPGSRLALSGITIPHWKEILQMSVKAQQLTGIGYLGVDIMIDRDQGPVIAELNARPGLGIQVANLAPLKSRLEKVEGLKIKSIKKGVRVGQDLFGGEIEEDVEDMTGKKILGIYETITVINPKTSAFTKARAKIDTGAFSTSIDSDLVKKIGYEDIVGEFEDERYINPHNDRASEIIKGIKTEYMDRFPLLADVVSVLSAHGRTIRPKIKVKITLGDVTFLSKATVAKRSGLKRKIIIGRKDLKNFIVNPGRINSLKKL
ncbi:MAG: sugar-transfer associated ATP-grasp domain-containing protein [Patescibacteria group bacterium]|nr:hypothetical protein [Patescibacteria group bacterium]